MRPGRSHLFERSLGAGQLVEQADGDAEHGGQSQTPADHLPPPRVHVHVVVGQRLVVDQVEQEDALNTTQRGQEAALRFRGSGANSGVSVLLLLLCKRRA